MNPLISSVVHSIATDSFGHNWVFSPASYLEAMYRLGICADGGSLKEIATALDTTPGGLPVVAARFSETVKDIDTYNCLLARITYRDFCVPTVLETLTALGGDFLTYSSSSDAVETVNRLVKEKTRGKITDLLSANDVKEMTQLIILNCVYFKRKWAREFDKPDYDEPFHNADGTVTKVGLLKYQTYYRYYEGEGYDLVEMKYRDTDVCCYLWVPTTTTIPALLDRFSEHYANVAKVKVDLDCHLTIPPFKVENTWNKLPEATRAAGIQRAFEETQDWCVLDWIKMGGGWAKVDVMIQKAYIDFTREGTEAAAATAFTMFAVSGCSMLIKPPRIKYIRADKPFVFALVNPAHPETPLFVGAVNKL